MPMSRGSSGGSGRSPEDWEAQVSYLQSEVEELRRRVVEAPGSPRLLEQRLADTQRSLAAVTAQNERLAQTLREARDQIVTLKEEVDRLAQPPSGFGVFLQRNEDDSIDVFTEKQLAEESIVIKVVGTAFLHSMIRIVVGTLVEVGRGRREAATVAEALDAQDRTLAGQTAPAHGLTLWEVRYPDELWFSGEKASE